MLATNRRTADNPRVTENRPDAAIRFLRRHYHATLVVDDSIFPRAFVIDPASGRPVIAAPPDLFDSHSVTLHVPDERDDALQLLVEPVPLDASRDAACDRLLIYHGRAEAAKFASLEIVDAKWRSDENIFTALRAANELHTDEPRLCRLLNSDLARFSDIVRTHAARETIEPKAVGVDPLGIDVRTRTGLVRLEFPDRLTREKAIATIESWMARA